MPWTMRSPTPRVGNGVADDGGVPVIVAVGLFMWANGSDAAATCNAFNTGTGTGTGTGAGLLPTQTCSQASGHSGFLVFLGGLVR